jgi:hypothetical protein
MNGADLRTLAWLGAGLVGLSVVVGFSIPFVVARSAAQAAGSAPYCVQIASNADYRPARTMLDLSGLSMWAKRESGMSMQHHAVLIVGDEENRRLLHWSYRKLGFVEGILNQRNAGHETAFSCVPQLRFVDHLALLFPQASETDYVRFSALEAYRIPKAYQSQWSGGSSRYLRLATSAPDFAPIETRWDDSNGVSVSWDPNWLLDLMKHQPKDDIVVARGTEFGLQKTTTVVYGRDGKRYEGSSYRVYADGQPNGVNATLIGCGQPTEQFPKSCQHRFLNNGRHFYFRHRPEDVANWRAMQTQLLDLFASFEVRNVKAQN